MGRATGGGIHGERMSMTVKTLADQIGATVDGEADRLVVGCAGIEEARADEVSFVANVKYARHLPHTTAAAVIVSRDTAAAGGTTTLLRADDPYYAFRQAVVILHGFRQHPSGVNTRAFVSPQATIGRDCTIMPWAYVEAEAVIGDRTVIYPHCYVGARVRTGKACVLYPSVTVYEDCTLGDRVVLHAGCVIGQDGFGYATHAGEHHKIPHVGSVVIEDDVEMGANCAIDRATVGATRVGKGTKFSDLVAIGHGTRIGRHNMLVGQVGIAGSSETGDYVVMGGQVGVAGHIRIGDQTQIAAKAGVHADIPDGDGRYGGIPAVPWADARRTIMAAIQLPRYVQKIRAMERRIVELERRLEQREAEVDQEP